uniref:Proteoglycan 4a n=1 Tax=Mastacembelus armatus TaxID=205130 RepID=A0A3Q3LTM3_9TELE
MPNNASTGMLSHNFLLNESIPDTQYVCPGSCVGRCGEVFTRGQQCTCDFSCLLHNECCQDFESTCTTARSCQGRCGEPFRRGQLCECDPQCVLYNTCCTDLQLHCGKTQQLPPPVGWTQHPDFNTKFKIFYFPGVIGQTGPRPRPSTLQDVAQVLGLSVGEVGSEGLGTGRKSPAVCCIDLIFHCEILWVCLSSHDVLCAGVCLGLFAAMDICGDSPMNGLTALSNGTILIFKGELFWSVDPVSRSVGQPQSIIDTLGVSSPIDTVFTRYNCHRNTYIVKGDQYWRLDETMVVEPGFPKPLASEFPGLTGSISAALAVPATGSTPETVYFFKKGDIIQRYIFPPSSTPCSMKPRSSLKRHLTRKAEVLQSEEINIRVSLKGFPTPVTSALSMPSLQRADIYHHYVFSGPNMAAQNANRPQPANSIRVWLRCP